MSRKRLKVKFSETPVVDAASEASPSSLETPVPSSRWANWWIRFFWTFVMLGLFIGIVLSGHAFVMAAVMIIVTMVYREIILIGLLPIKELKVLPWFRSIHWFFYFVTLYFLYIGTLIHYFQPSAFVGRFLMLFVTHHEMLSFLLYMGGFVAFVMNLKKGFYRFQFYQYVISVVNY